MTTKTAKKDGGRIPSASRKPTVSRRPVAARFAERGYWADHSGTIQTPGQSQALLPRNDNRNGFLVQNVSDADLFIRDGADATGGQPSLRIAPGVEWRSPDSGCPT